MVCVCIALPSDITILVCAAKHEVQVESASDDEDESKTDKINADKSSNKRSDIDVRGQVLVDSLRAIRSSSCKARAAFYEDDVDSYCNRVSSLTLREEDVAKVTYSRITALTIHPSNERTLVCAGDKYGNVGFWDAGGGGAASDASAGGNDGVYMYTVHESNVSALHFAPMEPQRLWSVSYDGSVRCTDVEHGHFIRRHASQDLEYSSAAFDSSVRGVNSIFLGAISGDVCCVDARSGSAEWTSRVSNGEWWCYNIFAYTYYCSLL
jgi:WD40 repeat protein